MLAPNQMAFDFWFCFSNIWSKRKCQVWVGVGWVWVFLFVWRVFCGGGKNSFDLLCDLFLHSYCSRSVHAALDWNESLDNNNQGNFYSWLQVTSFRSAF